MISEKPSSCDVNYIWLQVISLPQFENMSLNPHMATMEADPTKAYNQDDATGLIRLNALRLKVVAKVQGKKK